MNGGRTVARPANGIVGPLLSLAEQYGPLLSLAEQLPAGQLVRGCGEGGRVGVDVSL